MTDRKWRGVLPVVLLGLLGEIGWKLLWVGNSCQAAAPAPSPLTPDQLRSFIKQMGEEAVVILIDEARSESQRQEEFGNILDRCFDLGQIGLFLVGKDTFDALEPQKKTTYLKTLRDYIIQLYLHKFEEYQTRALSKEAFHVGRAFQRNPTDANAGFSVQSTIDLSNGDSPAAPLKVDWRVANTLKGPRIVDVYVNDLSMSQTKREEFKSLLKKGGIDLLIQELESKTNG